VLLTTIKKVKHFIGPNATIVLEVAKKKGPYGPYPDIKKRMLAIGAGLNHLMQNRLMYFT
jgi:hypothetical protein